MTKEASRDLWYSKEQQARTISMNYAMHQSNLRLFGRLKTGEEVEYTQIGCKPGFDDAVYLGKGVLSRIEQMSHEHANEIVLSQAKIGVVPRASWSFEFFGVNRVLH